ncbi:hypothetical protein [Hyphococcus sp.]|uniref:hypothetical protein n=1 Tax=Hyphococcus sp. TaxID=2038636 RepID=UPI003D1105D2
MVFPERLSQNFFFFQSQRFERRAACENQISIKIANTDKPVERIKNLNCLPVVFRKRLWLSGKPAPPAQPVDHRSREKNARAQNDKRHSESQVSRIKNPISRHENSMQPATAAPLTKLSPPEPADFQTLSVRIEHYEMRSKNRLTRPKGVYGFGNNS